MSDTNHYHLMASYNRWMNEKLYALCATLSDQERKLDRGAFFRSIHGTLDHLLLADKIWMGRFVEKPFQVALGQELYTSFEEMRAERQRMDDWIITWTRALDPAWLLAPFSFVSGVDGKTRIAAAWVLVTHMFNHQTHHRGQLTTLLKQAGVDPGVTDIPWMPESGTVTR